MANVKKQYYVVLKGRVPGIYQRWSGEGGAEEQVKGFPGAVYKGFAGRAEAEFYYSSGGRALPPSPAAGAAPNDQLIPGLWPGALPPAQEAGKTGAVIAFTDGSSIGNPGPGGYGVVLLKGKARQELSGGFRCTTNNRMELLACIVALRQVEKPVQVVLYSDSRYVVNAVQKGWARRWQKNGWMRSASKTGIPQRAENSDLWEELLALLDRFPVEFHWVKGHASNPENERCDRLAVEAARRRNLPRDPGYQGSCG